MNPGAFKKGHSVYWDLAALQNRTPVSSGKNMYILIYLVDCKANVVIPAILVDKFDAESFISI